MIKTFVILDSQPGNARLMTVVADMLKKSAGEADSFLLLTNQATSKVYQNPRYAQTMKLFKMFHMKPQNNFGTTLSEILKDKPDSEAFVFKTTLPIQYTKGVFDFELPKQVSIKDNWFQLPGIDTVMVPDRSGKVFKIGQTAFVSQKLRQNVQNIRRQTDGYQPDYFLFGRQFLQVLLMVNQFKDSNFAYVIHQASLIKKPIQVKGKRYIKKMWNFIPNHQKYGVIPQFVQPIVKSVGQKQISFLKIPTIVGNSYFKNSSWFNQVITRIQDCKFINDVGRQVVGKQALAKIAVKYDMDPNGAVYVAKFMKQLSELDRDMKFDLYTKNSSVVNVFQQLVQKDLLRKITFRTDINYNVICNVLDYIQTGCVFKFDFNYFHVGKQDMNVALNQMFGLSKMFSDQDTVLQAPTPTDTQTLVVSTPASPILFNQGGTLFNLKNMLKQRKIEKFLVVLEPTHVNAANPKQYESKLQRRFKECQDNFNKIKPEGRKVQFLRPLYKDQREFVKKIVQIRNTHSQFYCCNRSFIMTLAANMGRKFKLR